MSVARTSDLTERAYVNNTAPESLPKKNEEKNNNTVGNNSDNNSNNGSKNEPMNIIDKVELSDESKDFFKLRPVDENSKIKLSKEAFLQVQMSVKMMSSMKQAAIEGKSTGDYLADLTIAYDNAHKTLNENSENSNKHGKLLDNAFKNILQMQAGREAIKISRSLGEYNAMQPDNPIVESLKKQADLFAETFTEDYKKYGSAGFETALNKLNNMPETDSLDNISYKDFKLLSQISENSYLPEKSEENSRLWNELSDFLKNTFSLDMFGDHISEQVMPAKLDRSRLDIKV